MLNIEPANRKQMRRQAIITLQGDMLNIDLPNAVIQISHPTGVPAFRAGDFPRSVNLDVCPGRFAVPDKDHKAFITYEEKYQEVVGGLPGAPEMRGTGRNMQSAFEDDQEPAVTEHDYTPARGRSPEPRARGSWRAPDLQKQGSRRNKSHSPLFTREISPLTDVVEREAKDPLPFESQRRSSGPPEVPLWNVGAKAMAAGDRYHTPPPRGPRSLSHTPASKLNDRFIKDLSTIQPRTTPRQNSAAKKRRGSNSSTQTSALSKFNSCFRVLGRQPLHTKYQGTAGLKQAPNDSGRCASEALLDEGITTIESRHEPSPTVRIFKRRKSEGSELQRSFISARTNIENIEEPTDRKNLILLPSRSSGKGSETEFQSSPVTLKNGYQKTNPLKRRKEITPPPKSERYNKAKPQLHAQDHQASCYKNEASDTKTLTIIANGISQKFDKPINRNDYTPPPPPAKPARLKRKEKPQLSCSINPQRQHPAPTSSKQLTLLSPRIESQQRQNHDAGENTPEKGTKRPALSPLVEEHPSPTNKPRTPKAASGSSREIGTSLSGTKRAQGQSGGDRYENSIVFGTMIIEGKRHFPPAPPPPPPPSPARVYLHTRRHRQKAARSQRPSLDTKYHRTHTQLHHRQEAARSHYTAGNGKKRPVASLSFAKQRHDKSVYENRPEHHDSSIHSRDTSPAYKDHHHQQQQQRVEPIQVRKTNSVYNIR
ncbi:MAG: hypothetical protein Q9216_004834 [Gyalolechia sp. 2 TL-2023]